MHACCCQRTPENFSVAVTKFSNITKPKHSICFYRVNKRIRVVKQLKENKKQYKAIFLGFINFLSYNSTYFRQIFSSYNPENSKLECLLMFSGVYRNGALTKLIINNHGVLQCIYIPVIFSVHQTSILSFRNYWDIMWNLMVCNSAFFQVFFFFASCLSRRTFLSYRKKFAKQINVLVSIRYGPLS